jgi:hypothetical protein
VPHPLLLLPSLAEALPPHHMGVIPAILIVLAVLVVCAAVCFVSPTRRCPKCKGKRMIHKGRRAIPCPRCRAHGRVPRRGSVLVHRAFWAAFCDPLKARLKRGSD